MFKKTAFTTIFTTAITAIVSVVAVIATAKLAGPLPISVSQTVAEKQSTFNVTGESEMTTVPDQAEITMGIEVRKPNVATAQNEANTTINSITKELTNLGIKKENIKTQNYNIRPEHDWESPNNRITGYVVSANLRVKIEDFEKMNQAIDIATAQGANQVGGINFTLSNEKEEELKKDARKQAIEDAKENAKELANLAGVKLGKVVNVIEHTNNVQPPYPMMARAEMADGMGGGGEPTSIEPGSQTYTYTVTLSYETL